MRSLLMAGIATAALFTGAFGALEPVRAFDLTDSPDGGWPGQTGAQYRDGITFFGYVDGAGNIEARSYDHATGVVSAAASLHALLEADHHNDPELFIRPDGYIVAIYMKHNGTSLYRRISSSALDISAWGAEADIDSSVGGAAYTYPHIEQLTGEANDPLLLFLRDRPNSYPSNPDADMIVSRSTDGGSTWGAKTVLWQTSGIHYFRVVSDGDTRYDVLVSDGTAVGDDADLYHFYYDNGSYYDSLGNDIGSPPFTTSEATKVYTAAAGEGVRLPKGIEYAPDGSIVGSFASWGVSDMDYRYVRWDGSTWAVTTITNNGGLYDGVEGSSCQQWPYVYVSKVADGEQHLYRYRSDDDGATWQGRRMTTTGGPHIRPVGVHDGVSPLLVLWLEGDYPTQAIRGGW